MMTAGRDALAAAFASAPFSDSGWMGALDLMGRLTGSARGQLIALGTRHFSLNLCTEMSAESHANFAAIQGFRRDVNWRIAAEGGVREVVHEVHYDAARARHLDEAYLDHVRRYDCEWGMQTVIARTAGATFGLASLRTQADGRSTEEDRDMFTLAVEPVMNAIRMQVALEHQGVELLRGALDAMQVAALLVDGDAGVCGMTPGAEMVLSSGSFRLNGKCLACADPRLDAQLQPRIDRALRGFNPSGPDLWTRVAGRPCLVEVNRLPQQEWAFNVAPRMIVTFRFPVPIGRDDAGRLASALPLTLAEAEVVALLAAGLSRAAIAGARGSSVATVNSQMRTIFAKCEVRREAELVALAVRLLAPR